MKRRNPLIALLQLLDDGIEFYRRAARETRSFTLQETFDAMADIREFAAAHIKPYIDPHDLNHDAFTGYHGTLTNRYAPLLKKVVSDESRVLLPEIEEHLVDAMRETRQTTQNGLAQYILSDLERCVVRNLDQQLARNNVPWMADRTLNSRNAVG